MKEELENDFYEVLPVIKSSLTLDAKVGRIKTITEKLLKSTREETIKEIREKIERYFAALQTRIPLPDPITTQDELLDTLTEKE